MIKLDGKLKTKVIHGRNGDFTVGTLITNIGEFSVKDPMLDQYAEGEYDGEFMISKIFPSSYAWSGGVRVEIRAVIESFSIICSDEKPMPTEQVPDPIAENTSAQAAQVPADVQKQSVKTKAQSKTQSNDVKSQKAQEVSDSETISTAIFGDIQVTNQPGDEIKLDPTIDRQLFRQQRDALREMNYQFDAKRQVWVK